MSNVTVTSDGRSLLSSSVTADEHGRIQVKGVPITKEGTRLSRPEGSFVLWVEMPPGVDTLKLHKEALKHRINTAPGAMFSVKDRYRNCLRMNCGLPWSDPIEAALRTLGELSAQQLR